MNTPNLIFIVPYRNRENQYNVFKRQMSYVLEDEVNYKILYIHQKDNRDFNRGALKNIGFIIVKQQYPDTYKDITLVFNDIDTMPTQKLFDYRTQKNNIKHFYGFRFALGGIVSINAEDFEIINGFPNYWSWGYEDNELQARALVKNINIDRSVFYNIGDSHIAHLMDGIHRTINKNEYKYFKWKSREGINSIHNLQYSINHETNFIDVTYFSTGREPRSDLNRQYNLSNGSKPFKRKSRLKMTIS
tara:strand:+ start:59 stop:796 length:738 start_codon:yes stop_codon:yes gene_type:complete